MENECQLGRAAPPDLVAKSALLAFLFFVRRRLVGSDEQGKAILGRLRNSEREQLLNDLMGFKDFAALSGFRESDIPVLARALEIVCDLAAKLESTQAQRLKKAEILARMTEAESEVASRWTLGWLVLIQLYQRTKELERLPLRCVKETRIFSGSAHGLAILALLRHEQAQAIDGHRIVKLFLNEREWRLLRRSVDADQMDDGQREVFIEKFAADRKLKGFAARVICLDRTLPADLVTPATAATEVRESIFDYDDALACVSDKSPTLINGLSVVDTVIMEAAPEIRRPASKARQVHVRESVSDEIVERQREDAGAAAVSRTLQTALQTEEQIAAFLTEELEKAAPVETGSLTLAASSRETSAVDQQAVTATSPRSVQTPLTTAPASSAAKEALSPQRKLNKPPARQYRARSTEEDSESLTQDILEIAVGIFLLCVLLFVVPQGTYYFGIWWWSWFFGAGAALILIMLLGSVMRFGSGRLSSG